MSRRLMVCGVVAVALATAGCASAPASTQSPQRSQDTLLALLDDVQAQIGGTWVNEDSPSPRGCELAGGDDGVTFTGTRSMAAPAMTEAEIDDLLAFFDDAGFDAGKSGMGVLTDVLAVDPDDATSFVEVRIGDQSTQLTGQAACAVGDINVELDRVKSEQ
jgi:hypothetical protein